MTSPARPRVLTVQHVSAEPLGSLGDVLQTAGIALEVVRIDRGDAIPPTASAFDGVVVMGGPMGVYEADRFPFLTDELRLLRDALRRERPILGICLGSQLLAAACGSRVFPSGLKEIGWYPLALRPEAASDELFAGLPATFQAFHWHGDTFDLPAGAVRLASSSLTVEQGFRVGRSAYGLQFHLEVTRTVVEAMMVGAEPELAAARVSPDALLADSERHLDGLEAVARTVFGRWAGLVRSASRA